MCYCFFRLIGYWAQECHLPSSEGKTRIYTIGQAPHQKAEFLNGILHFPQAGGIPSSSDSSMKLATRECIAQYPWGPQKKNHLEDTPCSWDHSYPTMPHPNVLNILL